MRRKILILLFLFAFLKPVQSQHYVTPSLGYSLGLFSSDDLNLFKDTYNAFNKDFGYGITDEFRGLSQPVGLRLELAYQYFGKLAYYSNVGFQNFVTKDFAIFDNNVRRELVFKQRSLFLEGGIGPRIKQFFIAATVTVYFNKKIKLESFSNALPAAEGPYPLDGEYESNKTISTDFGIAIGIVKDPVTLTLKFSYPLFTGGKNEVLVDDNLAKIAAGTSVFPDHFDSSLFGEPYKGIESNIDGFKIMFTLGIPLALNKSDDDW